MLVVGSQKTDVEVNHMLSLLTHEKNLIRRWDSKRELFHDDIVQSTIDSCINSAYHSIYCKPEAKHHNKKASTVKQNLNNKLKVSNGEIHSTRECVNVNFVAHANFTAICVTETNFDR